MMSEDTFSIHDTSYEHVYSQLEEIFESCITEADTSDLIATIGTLYDCFNGQGFENSFDQILLYILSESKRSSEVNKILRFISECVVSLDNKYKTAAKKNGATDEEIDNIVHPLLKRLFKTLCRWSQATSYTVRYRSCQLLFLILTFIQDHGMGEIDMQTYENISSLIESRRLDVSSIVRSNAIHLAKFFQDPSVVNDPVIAGLCWQMQNDPNSRVRQNIVSIIAACEETIMPIAKLFLYDKNASVRNAALLHICKRIGPRSFTPSQRVLILQQCFTDPSDVIRQNAEQKLIPVWFRACGDKLCSFFKHVRVGNESLDSLPYIKELRKILSKFVKVSQILEEIELDTNSCLPKLPLSGEKVFLWRHFFEYSTKDERLRKFFPPLETLIPFILKCFDDCSSADVEICVFTELILFLMDIMEHMGIQKCEDVFPMSLNLMRHPFVPHEIMPYLVALYLTFSPKEKEHVHNDILEVIEDLQKIMQLTDGHQVNILEKCFVIASQILMEETSLNTNIRNIKENLIVPHLNSEDEKIKNHAISLLVLYCLLDIKESKLSWSLFEDALQLDSSPVKNTFIKGAFDILKCHGARIFADILDNGEEKFGEVLQNMLTYLEDGEVEKEIFAQGVIKLYSERHTSSPTLLANITVLYFLPDGNHRIKHDLETFFSTFGKTKDGYACLVETFLETIDLLFEANKNGPLYKVNIKTSSLQLLELAKGFEGQNRYCGEKFQSNLVVKLSKEFLKKPWRLSASELYSICSSTIPETFETLLALKEYIIQVSESLQSSIFQQKNPFAKKNIKNFCAYLKKIQTALNSASMMEQPSSLHDDKSATVSKKLEFDSSSSVIDDKSLKESDIIESSPDKQGSSVEESGPSSDEDNSFNVSKSHTTSKLRTPSVAAATPVRITISQFRSESSPALLETLAPSKTPKVSTRRLATPSRTKSACKMSSITESEVSARSFATPARNRSAVSVTESEVSARKIATPSRRSTRKAASVAIDYAEEDDDAFIFKTPAPRKTPGRKRNLDITITKT